MRKFELFSCKSCHVTFRGQEITNEEEPRNTPIETLRALQGLLGMPKRKMIRDHQCSPRIAGVADFAGVEFSEDE